MGYKIEYTPEYVKKRISERKSKIPALALLLLGVLALLFYREDVLSMIGRLEQLAVQLKQGDSIIEVFGTFSQVLQGVTGG